MRAKNQAGKEYIYALYYDCVDRGTPFKDVYARCFETLADAEADAAWRIGSYNNVAVRIEVREHDNWNLYDTIMRWDKDKGCTFL